jgi:two-component system chemotaxis response regulator CheY
MKKILVVDDSPVLRKIMLRVLREAHLGDAGLVEAVDGRDAMRRIGTDPSIGLVLSDVDMPGMDGIEFVRELRERRTRDEVRVLLLSSREQPDSAVHGADGWLQRPFDVASVRAALSRLGFDAAHAQARDAA